MNKLNDTQKNALLLVAVGAALAALAIHPPKWLTAVYLAFERAVAACAGVLLAVAGVAALLSPAPAQDAAPQPDYTIEFDDDDHPGADAQ